jgi:hypothetical protein
MMGVGAGFGVEAMDVVVEVVPVRRKPTTVVRIDNLELRIDKDVEQTVLQVTYYRRTKNLV